MYMYGSIVGCNYYEFELHVLAARSYGMQSDRRVWRTAGLYRGGISTGGPAPASKAMVSKLDEAQRVIDELCRIAGTK